MGVGGLKIGLLGPGGSSAHKDVRRASSVGVVIGWSSVHPGDTAGVAPGSNHDGVTRYSDGTEVSKRPGVEGFEVGLLGPVRSLAQENIGRAGIERTIVILVAVHAGRIAGLPGRANYYRVIG